MATYTFNFNEAAITQETTRVPTTRVNTILHQTKTAEIVDSVIEQYKIISYVFDQGEFFYPQIFVKTIKVRTEPKNDVFTRVGRVADLTNLPRSRDAALALSAGTNLEYLDLEATLVYTDLDTALQAQQALQDRVNALLNDYVNFRDNFLTTEVDVILPTVSTGTVNTLISAYKLAKQTRVNANKLDVNAVAALSTAQDKLTDVTNQVNQIQIFYSGALSRTNEIANLNTATTALDAAGATFLAGAGCASGPSQTAFSVALTAGTSAIAQGVTDTTSHTTYANSINTYLTTLFGVQTTMAADVVTKTTAKTTADTNLTNAQAAEAATLAAVLAVCPNFDPTAVIVCPTV